MPTACAGSRARAARLTSAPTRFGDLGLLHTATSANSSGWITSIDEPATNGQPGADLLITPNYNPGGSGGTSNNHPFGAYYAASRWRLFNEDLVAMPLSAHFNVMVPGGGAGLFRHVSSAANNSGWTTRLDDPSVNDLPERIVLATQNWSAGASIYNPHPIGVFYFAFGGPGSWNIVNADQQSGGEMPPNAGFNVYAQEASPNAFRVTASGPSEIVLDHPLLNGVPCAQVQATRLFDGASVSGNLDVFCSGGRWRIYGPGGMPAGTEFNVLVNPAQVFDCTDLIFADGFQERRDTWAGNLPGGLAGAQRALWVPWWRGVRQTNKLAGFSSSRRTSPRNWAPSAPSTTR